MKKLQLIILNMTDALFLWLLELKQWQKLPKNYWRT